MAEFEEDRDDSLDMVEQPPERQEYVGDDSQVAELFAKVHSGAGWFYWIAGLSIVNSLIALFGGGVSFIFGLGITTIIDQIAMAAARDIDGNGGLIVEGVAFVMSLVVSGVFFLFGVFAKKRHLWAFIVGMVLYAFDGAIFLLGPDWLSVGFHGFALFSMLGGLVATQKLNALQSRTAFAEA